MCLGNAFGWGGMSFGGLMMFLFWGGAAVLILLGIWVLARRSWTQPTLSSGGPGISGSRAMGILQERYARGELTKEQYDEMHRDLREVPGE